MCLLINSLTWLIWFHFSFKKKTSGKKAQQRGESVAKTNLQWHKDYNEQANNSKKDYSTHFDKIAKAGAEDQNAGAVGK